MKARFIIGILLILVGLSALTGLSLFHFFFSLLIIYIGIKMLYGKNYHEDFSTTKTAQTDSINEVVIFSPINKKIKSDDFKDAKLVLIFAGGELDLSSVKISEKEIDLEIVTIFGGLKLIVPKDWKIKSDSVAVIGGVENDTIAKGKKIVNLKGVAIFGGVKITN